MNTKYMCAYLTYVYSFYHAHPHRLQPSVTVMAKGVGACFSQSKQRVGEICYLIRATPNQTHIVIFLLIREEESDVSQAQSGTQIQQNYRVMRPQVTSNDKENTKHLPGKG